MKQLKLYTWTTVTLVVLAVTIALIIRFGNYLGYVGLGFVIVALILVVLGLWFLVERILSHRHARVEQQRRLQLDEKAQSAADRREQDLLEMERQKVHAEAWRAHGDYLKAQAEAAAMHMTIEQYRAALQAGLHYPGPHGSPVHISMDPVSGQPQIRPTDYRAMLPQHAGQHPTTLNQGQAPAQIGNLPLPGPLRDIDVLRNWDLRDDNVYLATGRGGHVLTCSLEGWHHIAHDAQTGGGKTLLTRIELALMIKLSVDVLICNPHFAPIDKRGHDWHPIGYHLDQQGLVEIAPGVQCGRIQRKVEAIRNLLKYLAEIEMDRRYDLQAQEIFDWTPLYIFVDEVPWLVEVYSEIADYLRAILQRGRAVDVRLTTNAQSFLVGNTGLGSGARDNFGTAYFLGGNAKSAAAMLGMGERELKQLVAEIQAETNQALGKGLGIVRNLERVPKAEPARVPYGTNDFQYYLLGKHDDWQLPEFRRPRGAQEVEGSVVPGEIEPLAPNPLHRADGGQPQLWVVPNASKTHGNEPVEQRAAVSGNVWNGSQNADLGAFQENRFSAQNVSESAASGLVGGTERVPNAFVPQPGDKLLDDLQTKQLIIFYQDCHDVKKSLFRIKNEKTSEGLGTGYYRYACWILDSRGLRKQRA